MSSPDTQLLTVELAYPLQRDGKQHKPDAVVELPADEARQLVRDGYARWPATPTQQTAPATAEE